MNSPKRKRITVKLKTPNPLFEKWLTHWRDKAKEKNSKMQHCFSIALASLKKYPLPLEHGSDCKVLHGFGDKLCKMLDDKLENYKNGAIIDDNISDSLSEDDNVKKKKIKRGSSTSSEKKTKANSPNNYTPQLGSGPYAILLTLFKKSLEDDYVGFLTKAEIIKNGQSLLTSGSFTKAEPGSYYTAWSSMKQLITKNLVTKKSNPAKFSLTEQGTDLAIRLYHAQSNVLNSEIVQKEPKVVHTESNINLFSQNLLDKNTEQPKLFRDSTQSQSASNCILDVPVNVQNQGKKLKTVKSKSSEDSCKESQKLLRSKSSEETVQSQGDECIIFPPNEFDIILYVDTAETSGKSTEADDLLLIELRKLAVNFEVKNLKVGDYAWVCRHNDTKYELVIPYIVERKRMDDFASSIKDGRYYEQKFRLKRSGIQKITYLIEKHGTKDNHLGLPLSSLHQAATNTAIQDGFCVKFTDSIKHTADYLSCLTNLLIKNFKDKTLVKCLKDDLPIYEPTDEFVSLMSFKEFNSSSIKNKRLKVREMFVRMLLQIKGLSVDRALAIVSKYPTPYTLHTEYQQLSQSEAEKLLAPIQFGDAKKKIGLCLSKTVHQLFTKMSF